MPTAKCNKCNVDYEFKETWFKRNDVETFVCRRCKIQIRTKSARYRKSQSDKSKEVLSDPSIKSRMSQMATLNNINNADKISKSVKRHYEDHLNRQRAREISKRKWQDEKYRTMVSEGLKKRWQDPDYRGKVLGSRSHYRKTNVKLEHELSKLGLHYELNFILASYEFDALIDNKYLYDEQRSREKELFVSHYFSNYTYINNLNLIQTPES